MQNIMCAGAMARCIFRYSFTSYEYASYFSWSRWNIQWSYTSGTNEDFLTNIFHTYIHLNICVWFLFNLMLQVNAELQVPSPFVPTRESYFLRYCKRHVDGIWAVVDISLNHLHTAPSITCRRRPSGCLIQDLPNGHSKV